MKRALLICNPYSGNQKAKQATDKIVSELSSHDFSCQVFVSESIYALQQFIVREPFDDLAFIGLIGGDGTMHVFLNAMLQRFEKVPVPVALFPCGTGNAFNFDIGCTTIDHTLQLIYNNRCSFIDVAEVTANKQKLWTFNILGCGLVTDINRLAEKMRWLGALRYTVASLIKLMANPKSQLTITTSEGSMEGSFSFVLACNTRFTGKGMLMAPHAQLNDGKLDVLIVKACSRFQLLTLFPKIFKGEHLDASVLTYIHSNYLKVESASKPLPTNIDGELIGSTPLEVLVHANKLTVYR